MDNLSMNAFSATRAGTSYGKWKALHPVTMIIIDEDGGKIKTCPWCNIQFKTKNKKKVFCCDECRAKMGSHRETMKRKNKNGT